LTSVDAHLEQAKIAFSVKKVLD
jgi:hypothetical protein